MALGIMLSDLTYLILAYTGLSELDFSHGSFNFWVGMAGGIIMLIFGLNLLVSKVQLRTSITPEISNKGMLRVFGAGYGLNILNPAVFVFWIGVNSWLIKQEYQLHQDVEYMIAIAATIFITDSMKVYFSNRLSRVLTVGVMKWIKRSVGVLLFGFGIKLIHSAIFDSW